MTSLDNRRHDVTIHSGTSSRTDWLESCFNADHRTCRDVTSDDVTADEHEEPTLEDRKGTFARLRAASRPHSTPLTLKWLEENYEIADGVCIPRSTLYVHYLDYCEKNDTQPVNAASFGKIIRQQFPQLTTRRLGTRGQSKYHYYGIGVRETSPYYDVSYSARAIQSSCDGKKENCKQIIAYSPRSKLGTLLPEFPDIKEINLPNNIAADKVLTFLMMYRTHCQRILDTVIRANFDEVQSFLLHFWQGMPAHVRSLLECHVLVTLVGVCDSILYRAIANVLMPTVLQPLPESLTQVIRKFSVQLDQWLREALDSLPHNLQRVKFDLARRFSQVLKRQTSLNHLCQAARTVIQSAEMTSQMLDDWINVDLGSIIKQTLYTTDNFTDVEHNAIFKLTRDFEMLLEDQAPLESYIGWLDAMVDTCVTQKSCHEPLPLKKTARQFLLMWSCFGTRVIRDMTLHSAPSFGSFHLLHLMFDEYVMYLVENLHNQDRAEEMLKAVRGEHNIDFLDSFIQSDYHGNKEPPCLNVMTSRVPGDVDRSSVIRGPEYTAHSGTIVGSPQFPVGPQLEQTCFPPHNMHTEQRINSCASPGHFSPGTSVAASAHAGHPLKHSPGYQPYVNQSPPSIHNNNNAANTDEWYDWSTAGQLSVSVLPPEMSFHKSHCSEQRHSKHSDRMCSHNHVTNDYQTYPSYCGNINNIAPHAVKRKTHSDVTDLNQKGNITHMYQYHVANLS